METKRQIDKGCCDYSILRPFEGSESGEDDVLIPVEVRCLDSMDAKVIAKLSVEQRATINRGFKQKADGELYLSYKSAIETISYRVEAAKIAVQTSDVQISEKQAEQILNAMADLKIAIEARSIGCPSPASRVLIRTTRADHHG